MEGTGTGYGFPFLTEMGAKIERSATDGRSADLLVEITELAGYLDRLEIDDGGEPAALS